MGKEIDALREAIDRGRHDKVFFAQYFLDTFPHDGQVRWLQNATRKIDVLVPGNRWGKSKGEGIEHMHAAFYNLAASNPGYTGVLPVGDTFQRAVDEAERMAGIPVKGVYAGIAGDHIRSINSRGSSRSRAGTTRSARRTWTG